MTTTLTRSIRTTWPGRRIRDCFGLRRGIVADRRYDLPSDYPLPAPDGGTLLSALFDEASGSSNVTIAYPLDTLDALVATYDTFFDGVAGETMRVPLTDGLASWQIDDVGYSVIVNGQNADVQVRLQTGI